MSQRERFSSRLGFILISAGCAIGLGNVWRFPYIVGKFGGGIFVLIYLFFLLILGLPIMVMEFSIGRASRKSCASSFRVLEPEGTKWHYNGILGIVGNYLLMMFYTTIGGWMVIYFFKTLLGDFTGKVASEVTSQFESLTRNPLLMLVGMVTVILIGFGICSLGLQNGVEKITKVMMISLLLLMSLLTIRSLTLEGGLDGLRFYLLPDINKMKDAGIGTVIYNAMGQAFFTLSIGIGSMTIFGSYMDKDRSLTGESISITLLDTFVAIMSGIIIFPACSAFGINPGSGPSLIFVTLPNIFNSMPGGRLWGTLFFLFMSFAALSTIIAVFENIVSFGIDLFKWSRKKSVLINIFLVIILSVPCLLGFNVLSFITPLGEGTNIMDFEDFIVSNNLLPLGSLITLFFCVSKRGWGFENFIKEADSGEGIGFPKSLKVYLKFVLPVLVLFIFVMGYYEKFFK